MKVSNNLNKIDQAFLFNILLMIYMCRHLQTILPLNHNIQTIICILEVYQPKTINSSSSHNQFLLNLHNSKIWQQMQTLTRIMNNNKRFNHNNLNFLPNNIKMQTYQNLRPNQVLISCNILNFHQVRLIMLRINL